MRPEVGPGHFATLMGRLAFPSLIALAPPAGVPLIERSGTRTTIATLTILAVVDVALVGILWGSHRCGELAARSVNTPLGTRPWPASTPLV
jgi:hypothetical protein